MGNFNLKCSLSAPGRKSGVLYLNINVKGDDKRASYLVPNLVSPNYASWDVKQQKFVEASEAAIINNEVITALLDRCNQLISEYHPITAKELVGLLHDGSQRKAVKTLGDFIDKLTDEQRKNPTKNYQLLISLSNNLKGVNRKTGKHKSNTFPQSVYNGVPLIDTPISEIANAHLAAFADWVKTVKNGANYRNLNIQLHHVIKVAVSRGLNTNNITYSFRADAPKKVTVAEDNEKALTLEQLKAVEGLSGTLVNDKGHRNRDLQQLYLDTALLMYYTMSRPADVILFRHDMIYKTDNGNLALKYIPFKKRTYQNAVEHTVRVPLSDEALRIIEKHKGQSKGGYILPFEMNNTKWDLTVKGGDNGCDKWRNVSNGVLGNVNAHLKKVGEKAGISFSIQLYTFRRSAISHALNRGENIMRVAKRAGTSVKMIGEHYYKDNEI